MENSELRKRLKAARNFPENTCPASRHTQIIGEALLKGRLYPMLADEPKHCAESMLHTVVALYETRTELARLRARIEAAIREVREAELFEDGIEADAHGLGIRTIADAYMAGREHALDELVALLRLPAGEGQQNGRGVSLAALTLK